MPKEPKGLEKRVFSTVPTKALFNAKITALEWRVLGLIALHDGMTLYKHAQGKPLGAGCIASNLTLAREAQCSYAALVRAVKSLELHGLIERHDRRGGKTEAAMRVRYDVPDNIPDGSEQYDETVTLNMTDPSHQYDENDDSEARRPAENYDETAPHYSSPRGELNSAEAGELNSPKARVVADAGRSGKGFRDHLPATFANLATPAKVACIDRAFSAVNRNSDAITTHEDYRRRLSEWLFWVAEAYGDDPTGMQAQRIYEEISE
ncbi:helix-turn-helix domain-containing protein [Sphingopyxis sp. 2PD]|uniref:MarR family transcriptional regulator n=1 Tax=Sphingopyxis sp. 2PD TaxID=2502196 RepID=UPI0010FA0C18|nr:helix-turn-helix domain-containing protein [Sphingopyxis sp. 2PD]